MKYILNYLLLTDLKPSSQLSWFGHFLAVLLALSVIMLVTGFLFMIPSKHNFYYGACAVSLIYLLCMGRIKFNKQMLAFYVVILLNVLIIETLPVFQSQLRACNFVFITLVCSPALQSQTAIAYRAHLFRYIMIGMSLMVVLSFFCFFLGINMMPFNRIGSELAYEDYENVGGKFSGLFNHSMIYGPIAAIVAVIYFNLYLKHSKLVLMVLFLLSSLSCVFSASRGALLALIMGIFMLILRIRNDYTQRNKINRVIYILLFSIVASIPIADRAFSGILNKVEITQDQYGGYNSREKKYDERLAEFGTSPIFGVGFAAVDPGISNYNMQDGRIEPGTAHLAVLAQTGLIGMIAYVVLLLGAYRGFAKRSSLNANIALCLFWLFFAHGWAEGWIFAVGGMISFLFWLSISRCYDLDYQEEFEYQNVSGE